MRYYIGIDPGASGFIAVNDGRERCFLGLRDAVWSDVVSFLREVVVRSGGDVFCCMEEVHAIYGSSAAGTFSFGRVFGMLEGLLCGIGIAYELVPPKVWQREMWAHSDKVYKDGRRVDPKKTSVRAASRLFPDVDFRRTERSKVIDDNKCDAMLICEYGRRRNM